MPRPSQVTMLLICVSLRPGGDSRTTNALQSIPLGFTPLLIAVG